MRSVKNDLEQPASLADGVERQPPAAVIITRELGKVYGSDEAAVEALQNVNIEIKPGTFTTVMGPSGSGKSTLLNILAGLDRPTSGSVNFDGVELSDSSESELTLLRRGKIGFVFQFFNLLTVLNAEENITLPLQIAGKKIDRQWLDQLLTTVGIEDRRSHLPSELSGGQQQRVAIARALLPKPLVVFADEPTGNLDSQTGAQMLDLLRRSVDQLGQTIVMVTHDAKAAATTDRILMLSDGRIVRDLNHQTTEQVLDQLKDLS